MAAGPQLLTVSRAPLHDLWLCLIEEQGYKGHHPSLELGQVCERQGRGRLAGHLGAEEGAAEESDLAEHPAWGSSRPGGKAGLDTLKDHRTVVMGQTYSRERYDQPRAQGKCGHTCMVSRLSFTVRPPGDRGFKWLLRVTAGEYTAPIRHCAAKTLS